MTTVTDYWDYMERKTRTRPVGKAPELGMGYGGDVVEFIHIEQFAGVYYSNSGIEVRPMTEEEYRESFTRLTFAQP